MITHDSTYMIVLGCSLAFVLL